jgi:hypothetical protein
MAKSDNIAFTVLWYNGGPEYAPNRCTGRDLIRKHDLTDAIRWAANRMLRHDNTNASYAHGFYVRKANAYERGEE